MKSIASFNVEIRKLDPKKENLKILPKGLEKIHEFIHSFIIQTSPSEKLIGNDIFLKFIYDNFYKIDIEENENSLKYVQEHDNNWLFVNNFHYLFFY